jgi:hypothetical protein
MINKIPEQKRVWIIIAVLILIMLTMNGKWVVFRDSSIEGQVVDAETGKPLEGVIVAGLWELTVFFSHASGGYAKISLVETDKEGKFKLPWWITFKPWTFCSSMSDGAPIIVIYKPGYKLSHRIIMARYPETGLVIKGQREYLEEINSINPAKLKRIYTDEERIQNYHDWGTFASFSSWHYSKKQTKIIYKALVQEMQGLSEKYKDKNLLIKSLQN